jgi:hypothetical protein
MASILNFPVDQTSPLKTLQANYALYQGGGEIYVVSNTQLQKYRDGAPKAPDFIRRTAAEILMKRDLEMLPISFKPSEAIRDFYSNPGTNIYLEVAFSPLVEAPTVLNLWRPPVIEPKKGDWGIIRSHLFNVICNGDRRHFSFLLRYLAHMLQRPEEKPGVMLVLLGKQGTGKGAFFQLLERIWSRSVYRVDDVDRGLGRFNAGLGQAYVVVLDEALFVGDRRGQDRMKSMITEPYISIEEKHQPLRVIRSFHRFIAASNHEHFAQVDDDDRRNFILRVSSRYKQNEEYFTRLFEQINSDDAVAAFMYALLSVDLNGFNSRQAPKTAEHSEQIMLSLTRFERYWFQLLWSGEVPDFDAYMKEWVGEVFIPTEKLASAASRSDPAANRYRPITPQEVAREITRLCPSATQKRKPSDRYDSQRRGYDLPALSVARTEFEAAKGFKVDWGEVLDPSRTLPGNARGSGRLKPNASNGFEQFARQTRHFSNY